VLAESNEIARRKTYLETCYTSRTFFVTMGKVCSCSYGVVMSYATWIKGMLLLVQVNFF